MTGYGPRINILMAALVILWVAALFSALPEKQQNALNPAVWIQIAQNYAQMGEPLISIHDPVPDVNMTGKVA